jgi:hypothetical protein
MPSRFAVITFLDGAPAGLPDNTLPSAPVYPGHALPPPGSIATLPVFPFDPTAPDNTLPGSQPGVDNTLPPVQIKPGARFVIKWLACTGLILVPDNTLPPAPAPK